MMRPGEFIGRVAELDVLERAYASAVSAFVPIYGRRRVGKSELILQFIRGKPGIYYLGKEAPGNLQLREFMVAASRATAREELAHLTANSWRDALVAVTARAEPAQPFVIVLDEFQWLAQASPELPSVLQELWDRTWQHSGAIMLIICGSLLGFMERNILGQKSPLYGRRTAQILLQPFAYQEAALFHPQLSLADRARVYFICGGIPTYLKAFRSPSVRTNIEKALLSETSPLFREPDFLLREELRELEHYYAVLQVLARGRTAAGEIARLTGKSPSSSQYYLKGLVDLGYVERSYPLTTAKPSKRSIRYELKDPLLRFWFRFIEPNLTFLRQLGPHQTFAERIKPEFEAYCGMCFERLCRDALPGLLHRLGSRVAVETGSYWDKGVQIDLVGLRSDGIIELGECKWGQVRSLGAIEDKLQSRIQHFANPENRTLHANIFVQRKRTPNRALRFSWWDLADLYGN